MQADPTPILYDKGRQKDDKNEQENVNVNLNSVGLRWQSKDTTVTFRVSSDSKQQLQSVAEGLEQSVARICEALLKADLTSFVQEEGKNYRGTLHRVDIYWTRLIARLISREHEPA